MHRSLTKQSTNVTQEALHQLWLELANLGEINRREVDVVLKRLHVKASVFRDISLANLNKSPERRETLPSLAQKDHLPGS